MPICEGVDISDREVDLMIRVLQHVSEELSDQRTSNKVEKLACQWMREDVLNLEDKLDGVRKFRQMPGVG